MRTAKIKDPSLKVTYLNGLFENDLSHPRNEPYDAIQYFDGLKKKRSCTDKCSCYCFIILNLFIFALSAFIIRKTDFNRLLYPQDFRTDYCGIKQLTKQQYAYWPAPLEWGPLVKACVPVCPSSGQQEVCLYNQLNTELVEDYCLKTYTTKAVKGHCIPVDNPIYEAIISQEMNSWKNFFINLAADLYRSQRVIVLVLVIILFIGTLFGILITTKFMQIYKISLFVMAVVSFLECFYLCYEFFLWMKVIADDECKGSIGISCARDRMIILMISIIFFVLTAAYIAISMICGFPKIMENFYFYNQMSRPIRNWTVLWIPLISGFIQILIALAFLAIYTLIMATPQNNTLKTTENFYRKEARKSDIAWQALYGCPMIMVALYVYLNAFSAFQRSYLTGMVSQWFFSKEKQWLKGRKMLYKGFCMVTKHWGSFMRHAFYVTPSGPYRSFATFFKRRFDKIIYSNTRQICCIKACWGCMLCHEKYTKFKYSESIYHLTIFGDHLSMAGIKFHYLKFRNWARFEKLAGKFNIFSFFFGYFISNTTLVLFLAISRYASINFVGQDLSKASFLPLIGFYLWLVSTYICWGFIHIVDISFEVLVFCFVSDEEMFQSDQRYSPHEKKLVKLMNEYGSETARKYLLNVDAQQIDKPVKQRKKDKKRNKKKKGGEGSEDELDGDDSYDDYDDDDVEEAGFGGKINLQSLIAKNKRAQEQIDEKNQQIQADRKQGDGNGNGGYAGGEFKYTEGGAASNLLKYIKKAPIKYNDRTDLRVDYKREDEQSQKQVQFQARLLQF